MSGCVCLVALKSTRGPPKKRQDAAGLWTESNLLSLGAVRGENLPAGVPKLANLLWKRMRPHRVEDRRQVHGSVGRGIWLLVGLAGALAYVSKGSGCPLRTAQDSMAPFAFSAPAGSGYAGASACASCHRAIYEKFRR